ncbi:hypothetical protein C0992_001517 [Termitomyces sp. T32_za158]|nr:hypothetical protein C0992_001517 [Termitomyces sp. T32_za158]
MSFLPEKSIGRVIAVSKGDQLPLKNARLAELLSNPVPFHQQTPLTAPNDLDNSPAVISKSGQSSVVRPRTEQLKSQTIQPESTSLNQKRVLEKHSQEVGSRAFPVQKNTRVPEQFQLLQNPTTPTTSMLASTSQQIAPGYIHSFPPIADTTAQSQINQDHSVGSKSQNHVTSRTRNHDLPSSAVHIQKTQTHPHTHDDQNKGLRKGTLELKPGVQSLPVNNTYPVGITQITDHHQTSRRAARNKDQSKTSQKHNPVTQSSHTAYVDTAVLPNSSTSGGPPTKVSAPQKSSHQQSQGILSTRDNDCNISSHKLAKTSSSKHLVLPSNVPPDAPSMQRTEPPGYRSQSNTPINNLSTSHVDPMPNRHVLPSSSQLSQPSLQTPSPSVSYSAKQRSASRNHGKTATQSTAAVYPSKSSPDQQGATAPNVLIKPTALQQSISTASSLPPDRALSRNKREVSRRPSEDSVLLRTPSSLTPTALKPSTSRTSIPASFSSQASSKKRGLFSMFRSKLSPSPDQGVESQKHAPRKLRKEAKPRAESFSDVAPPPEIKITPTVSSRAKAPSIMVPITVQPGTERKSPNKVFTPFRYLTTKKNRRVSQASLEAQDGTAPLPIQVPPLRDVLAATQEWRRMEAAEVREVTGGKMRRARPGVVFDVAEDHTEEDRPKIRPQARQS